MTIGCCAIYCWKRLTPKRRLLLLLIVAIAFVMLGCDDSGIANILRRVP